MAGTRSGGGSAKGSARFPIEPPVEPMLAKLADDLPGDGGWLFEPKWDGFRAIVFKDGEHVYTQSRDLRPLDRYFPELGAALAARLPSGAWGRRDRDRHPGG
jgi:ATP-dependent DNA ligase